MGSSLSSAVMQHLSPYWREWIEDPSVEWDKSSSPFCLSNQKGRNRNRRRGRRVGGREGGG